MLYFYLWKDIRKILCIYVTNQKKNTSIIWLLCYYLLILQIIKNNFNLLCKRRLSSFLIFNIYIGYEILQVPILIFD